MPDLQRTCQHEDVGDCDPEYCFGIGRYAVACSNCGSTFDLNHGGGYEHDGGVTNFACPECLLPSEVKGMLATNPTLVAILAGEAE